LKTSDFHYDLPDDLIAAHPPEQRSGARMMVVDRATGEISHRQFTDFPGLLRPSDLVVLNDTRVVPARVFSDDGRKELLRLEDLGDNRWRCLVRPGRKLRSGREVVVGGITGRIVEVLDNGDRIIAWDSAVDLDQHGHLALPHYMDREDEAEDRERYQTVFAKEEGAIAAPTAGLHFTPELLETIPHTTLTLHVGIGTFRPVKAEHLEDHEMHSESFAITDAAAERIRAVKADPEGRLVAVGTTVTRVLEHLARQSSDGQISAGAGDTDIFLYPGQKLRCVDALLTNFHLPESTLIMLVSAMAGRELVLEAYRKAVEERYRFYSYGDCMLIL